MKSLKNWIGLFLFLAISSISFANGNTIEAANKNPMVKQPTMHGTNVPIDEMNTSPNPTPLENESKKSRGSLLKKNGEVIEREEMQEMERIKDSCLHSHKSSSNCHKDMMDACDLPEGKCLEMMENMQKK